MGCEGSKTIEDAEPSNGKAEQNLVERSISGLLDINLPFADCLITSNEDLTKNIKDFIQTQIVKEGTNQLIPNINDELVTDSIQVDFTKNYVIALNAITITRIIEIDGNYIMFHNNMPGSRGKYTALLVKRLPGVPKIIYASPKPLAMD